MGMRPLYKYISRYKNRDKIIKYSRSRDFEILNINIRSKLVLIKLLRRKLVDYKNILKPRINQDVC